MHLGTFLQDILMITDFQVYHRAASTHFRFLKEIPAPNKDQPSLHSHSDWILHGTYRSIGQPIEEPGAWEGGVQEAYSASREEDVSREGLGLEDIVDLVYGPVWILLPFLWIYCP